MSEATETIRELTVELPISAPMIRVTAGYGSAGQKTWNLRRPVTVIGSRRPAHIVLHDQDVSNAHCVIINTGSDVLVKDLHTSGGTQVNKTPVTLAALKDGDVVTLGDTSIQIAIQMPENAADDSGAGLEYADPVRFAGPMKVHLMHTGKEWSIEEAVVLIGRHDDAEVRLDHADISSRHALLFRFGHGPAVFDLGSRTGIWVNGQRCSLTPLQNGDHLTVGPFGLEVQSSEFVAMSRMEPSPASVAPVASRPTSQDVPAKSQAPVAAPPPAPSKDDRTSSAIAPSPAMDGEPEPGVTQGDIAGAWERLNSWRTQLRNGAMALDEQQQSLATREAGLDARDAALRGQLHDVTRFHEQLIAREREMAAKAAQAQAEQDVLEAAKKTAELRDAELAKREQEVSRRENAVAQRWARLNSMTCPHCRKPVSMGSAE